MADTFSIKITLYAIFIAAITWIVITAWDAVIDTLIYSTLPWDADSWQAQLVVAILLTCIAILILIFVGRNFGEFVGIEFDENGVKKEVDIELLPGGQI